MTIPAILVSRKPSTSMKHLPLFTRCCLVGLGLFFSVSLANAQAPATGIVEGRIINAASGSILENARVKLEGTDLEALTSSTGEYRLTNVPAGEVQISVHYSEFVRQTKSITIAAGQVATADYALELMPADGLPGGRAVELATFTVNERRLTAQALALNEQKVAANIKNVVSFEEFGDMGEGNPGEFLKYVPGVSINYGPNIPQFASIRGMPANGTLVTVDGGPIASSAGDRQFELTGAATGNIDRIEVTKSPTPDMPANAIGGAINIVGKSGFSRTKPLFTYSVYGTFNLLDDPTGLQPSFSKRAGTDSRTAGRTIQPGVDLSYILPVNDKLALTFSAGMSTRYNYYDSAYTLWNLVTNVDERFYKTDTIIISDRTLAAATVDWRLNKENTFRFSAQISSEHFKVATSTMDFRFGANATGDVDSTQGRAGAGSVFDTAGAYNSDRDTNHFTFRYNHDGRTWKFDADATYSQSERENADTKEGTFSGFTASYSGLTLSAEGMDQVYTGLLPKITATNGAGAAVNVTDAGGMPITAAAAAVGSKTVDTVKGARMNLSRSFSGALLLRVQAGVSVFEEGLDTTRTARTWAFAVPGGAGSNTANALNLISDEYSAITNWYNTENQRVPVRWISPEKLYGLYLTNPSYFTLNEAAKYTGAVNASKFISETISAAYVRFDSRSFENRLRIVTGVRFEKTKDDGQGPLNDIGATYARDAAGNILRTSAGVPIRVTTDALELAKLQYVERGIRSQRSYEGFYPSLNASFEFTEKLIARAAYARTIGRPAMVEITPGVVFPNPTTTARTITLNNPGLLPWTSDNYDLSLETYDFKGAMISVGVFRKDISDFFSTVVSPMTPELLAEYGLSEEYSTYDISTKRNGGEASLTGFEWSYRQSLNFLPGWARGFHVFINGTHISLSGQNADDFTSFSPKNINWGVSYARARFLAKVNVAQSGKVRNGVIASSATVPVGAHRYIGSQTTIDLSAQYRLSKLFTLYGSVRNAGQADKYTLDYAESTPEFARVRVVQRFGAMFTLGIKGEF